MEMTWAEDRALVGTDPSADPGALKRRAGGTTCRPPLPFALEHQCDKSRGLGRSPGKAIFHTNRFGNYPLQPANSTSPKLRFPVDQDTKDPHLHAAKTVKRYPLKNAMNQNNLVQYTGNRAGSLPQIAEQGFGPVRWLR
jgi:hypothetical protein